MSVHVEPLPARHLRDRQAERQARREVVAELRRRYGWSKAESRGFYDRLVHHDRLRRGRAIVHALGMPGR